MPFGDPITNDNEVNTEVEGSPTTKLYNIQSGELFVDLTGFNDLQLNEPNETESITSFTDLLNGATGIYHTLNIHDHLCHTILIVIYNSSVYI